AMVLEATPESKAQNEEKGVVPDIVTYTDKWGLIPEIEQEPNINGKLDDPIWEKASELDDFVTAYYNESAAADTNVQIAYDEENLYLGITQEGENDSLANVDIVLWPDSTGEEYFYVPIHISDFGVPE